MTVESRLAELGELSRGMRRLSRSVGASDYAERCPVCDSTAVRTEGLYGPGVSPDDFESTCLDCGDRWGPRFESDAKSNVVDLMEALEQSVAAAKLARLKHNDDRDGAS